jgi:archaellin
MSDLFSVHNSAKSTPLDNSKSTPLVLSAQLCGRNKYVNSKQIKELAIEIYKAKGGRGITYTDLLETGLAVHKKHAQDMLKYHVRTGTLFILENRRPQQYYPTEIKSDIIENKQKSTPIDPSGVVLIPSNHQKHLSSKSPLSSCIESMAIQTLEGYVLPLLPTAPSFIHNMQFKTKVTPACYTELDLPHYKRNYGKCHTEIVGATHIDYVFYSSGTVNVTTTCSRDPHKLETEEDRSRLIAFLGQIRDRLIILLADKHERLVPDIMDWQLTECDINKDIKVSHFFHYTGIKIQVKHADHLFRVYVKSMGADTVCRVEQLIKPRKEAVEAINDIFNPSERIEKRLTEIEQKVDAVAEEGTKKKSCANNDPSLYDIASENVKGDKSN